MHLHSPVIPQIWEWIKVDSLMPLACVNQWWFFNTRSCTTIAVLLLNEVSPPVAAAPLQSIYLASRFQFHWRMSNTVVFWTDKSLGQSERHLHCKHHMVNECPLSWRRQIFISRSCLCKWSMEGALALVQHHIHLGYMDWQDKLEHLAWFLNFSHVSVKYHYHNHQK